MIDERAGATFDERPGAADETLADREDQSRQAGRKKQKTQPHGERREHPLRHARKRRRGDGRNRRERDRNRYQKPNRLAVSGDVIEELDQPRRRLARRGHCRRVERDHRRCHDDDAHQCADGEPQRGTPFRRHGGFGRARKQRERPGDVGAQPV